MYRFKLTNKYNKYRTDDIWNKHRHQRNTCVSILKGQGYAITSIKTPSVTNSKKFWKAIKPIFIDKMQISQSITFFEKEIS